MSLELTVEGDTVVEARTHVGYLHRGFEKLMERRTFIQNFPLVCRICVPEPDFNEYLYAATVEELAGIEVPEKANWLRILTLEMARLTSFLQWIGGQAGAFGMGTIGQWSMVPTATTSWTSSRSSPADGSTTCTLSPAASGRTCRRASRVGWSRSSKSGEAPRRN